MAEWISGSRSLREALNRFIGFEFIIYVGSRKERWYLVVVFGGGIWWWYLVVVFPSLQRRGGRAIKKCCEASFERRGRGGQFGATFSVSDHPVCAASERELFLSGAATPPVPGGEYSSLTFTITPSPSPSHHHPLTITLSPSPSPSQYST